MSFEVQWIHCKFDFFAFYFLFLFHYFLLSNFFVTVVVVAVFLVSSLFFSSTLFSSHHNNYTSRLNFPCAALWTSISSLKRSRLKKFHGMRNETTQAWERICKERTTTTIDVCDEYRTMHEYEKAHGERKRESARIKATLLRWTTFVMLFFCFHAFN